VTNKTTLIFSINFSSLIRNEGVWERSERSRDSQWERSRL